MKRVTLKQRASRLYRQTTSPLRRLPDFLVIGVVKGGTTSIYKYLTQHPQIASATAKEVHYFKHSHYAKYDANWYRSHFPLSKMITGSTKLTGEASPEYFHNPEGPTRVQSLIPDVKLVLLLRNPIDRAYSHYSMNMKNRKKKQGLDPKFTFEQMAEEEIEILGKRCPPLSVENASKHQDTSGTPRRCCYLSSGIYLYSLHNWLSYFAKENLLILSSEDLFENPHETTNKVFNFLGLPEYKGSYPAFNVGSYYNFDTELRDKLANFFKPYNDLLFDYLNYDFGWNQ